MAKRSYIKYDIKCKVCKNSFQVPAFKKDTAKYCSKECRITGLKKTVETDCGYCKKPMTTLPSKIRKSASGLVFCSNTCVGKYNSDRDKDRRVKKNCLICNQEYSVKPSEAGNSVSCSRECQSKWQSKYLRGKKASNYKHDYTDEMRTHNCNWCDKEYKLKAPVYVRDKNNKKPLFCSKECYREWYAKEWSQQESWKAKSREKAINMFKNGQFNKLNTTPHKMVSELLNKMGIEHINEYDCKYFVTDIYLTDYQLMIEINGDYWHCNPTKYNNINYKVQLDRVERDKAKNTYLKNNYGIDILYLWESDIYNSIDLCASLIVEYIQRKGKLDNYHSFNYKLSSKSLYLNKEVILPFSNYSADTIKRKFVPNKQIITSRKKVDKHVTFNCQYCGKEKEQLISRYNKNKTHCCSSSCSAKLRYSKPV